MFPVASATAEGKATPPAAPDPCTEHIAYQVDAAGYFNAGVGTNAQCEPQAGSWDLTYRWPYGPGTSFTTVKSESGTYVLGQDVPDFYAAFANFQDPEHIGAGLLKVPGEIVPNRVVFGTWPNLSGNVWWRHDAGTR
ncbi:MAG: hypothetical protein ABIS35_13170 [Terracoccus sp.]